ncbi:Mu transposase domain-containing protein [Streptomyces sp. NPDC002643]
MLTLEEDVDAHALRRQGWTISAIARHLGRDRKTIRAYLNGERVAGSHQLAPDALVPFLEYCRQRLRDDPHLWASTLYDEVKELGYTGAYSTFTRALRRHQVRPHCEPCKTASGRDVAVISHPPGEEIQFDWLELPEAPSEWGVGEHAHLLVGALAHSGRWRAVLAESEDFPHLVQGLDQIVRKLGGTARRWRFDRMATVCYPSTGRVLPAFTAVAKYYGVGVDVCPSRRGNRKGMVEKVNHSAAQRWWRTVPDGLSIQQAQSGVDKLAVRMDERRRKVDGIATTVAELADSESLLELPTRPFPAELEVQRTVSPQSLVSYGGNFYSVPPGLSGVQVGVLCRLGEDTIRIVTAGRAVVACHRQAPRGSGQTIRDTGHVIALEQAVLANFTDRAPCKEKVRRPPSSEALAEAGRLREQQAGVSSAERVVIDLSHYAAVADQLRHLPAQKEESQD